MSDTPMLNVRIKHKYDTYENWVNSTLVLEKGELAIAEIPSTPEPDFSNDPGGRLTPPAIGVKIGDGASTFSQLPWIQSTAGDVYTWAKKENLDFTDLSDAFKSELGDYISGKVEDTNTTYTFVYENDILTVTGEQVDGTTFEAFTLDLSAKMSVVDAVEGNFATFTADGNVQDSGIASTDFTTLSDSFDTLSENFETQSGLVSDLSSRIDTAEGKIDTLQDEMSTAQGSIEALQDAIDILNGDATVEGSVQNAVAGIIDSAPDAFNTLREIAEWITEDDSGAATLANRVAEVEELAHIHSNFDIIDAITKDDIDKWNASGNASDINDALSDLAGKIESLEGVVGDETSGLVADVNSLTTRITEAEENINTAIGLAEASVKNINILDMEGNPDTEAIIKDDETGNVEIHKIPVNILKNVENFTLIFNCGSATEVI